MPNEQVADFTQLAQDIKAWGKELGFQQVGITNCDLELAYGHLEAWLAKQFHGEMAYMAKNKELRRHPEKLVPGTIRIISVRLDYYPQDSKLKSILGNKDKAYVSCYTLGRDYHKVIRNKIKRLAKKINEQVKDHAWRAFTDSAPILERAVAEKAGLGWVGKNTMLMNRDGGSWFFLGELFTNIPLPIDEPDNKNHCGRCTACIDICPTQAIVAPYQLDARRCISYLTIEYKGSIPLEYRKAMGNRIYGCDDCQLCCPWNKFAKPTNETDFQPRHGLDDAHLIDLFLWNEDEFLQKTEGSAMRRVGYECWLRNLAVALGNASSSEQTINALKSRLDYRSSLVQEHVQWALQQHGMNTLR